MSGKIRKRCLLPFILEFYMDGSILLAVINITDGESQIVEIFR